MPGIQNGCCWIKLFWWCCLLRITVFLVHQPAEVIGLVEIPSHVRVWGIDSGIRHRYQIFHLFVFKFIKLQLIRKCFLLFCMVKNFMFLLIYFAICWNSVFYSWPCCEYFLVGSVGGADYGSVRIGAFMGRKMIKSMASGIVSASLRDANGAVPDDLEDDSLPLLRSEASLDYLCNLSPHR